MGRVVHFEVPADDPPRAAAFFEAAFGWTLTKWDGPIEYWLVDTGEGTAGVGINGGLGPRTETNAGIVNTVGVDDLDDAIEHVTQAGGRIVVPKGAVPGVGWLAYFVDTEGNTWGLLQSDENAA